ncbi:uncharacterized protein G2W53_026750 [Senna tora]|uniref:Uncharacterized protein n=1 Tax=Senna tora TaxID=362788 RepID=A0A834TG77_9FABA|nr:uncharacterized protein G2W53_026750 [Senna tora]
MEIATDRVNLSDEKAKKLFLPHLLPAIRCSEQRNTEKGSLHPLLWQDNMDSPQEVTHQ